MSEKPEIYIQNLQKKISYKPGETLQEACLRQRIPLGNSCGGMGTCTTCRVVILDAPIPLAPREELEQERAAELNLLVNERLSCQFCPTPKLVFEIPSKREVR